MKQLKEEKRVKEAYSDEELSKILSYKPKMFFELRLYALTLHACEHHCRIEEGITHKFGAAACSMRVK